MTEQELAEIKAQPKLDDFPKLIREVEELRKRIKRIGESAGDIMCEVLVEGMRESD